VQLFTQKHYLGNYTSQYNNECIVVCPLQQGRIYLQFVLLLYKNKQGDWQNGCWYYENIYRLKTQDLNKDSIQELIVETKDISGSRVFGKYKIISLINLNENIWYENNTLLGTISNNDYKKTSKNLEITRDIKVSIVDSKDNLPNMLKERKTIGYFNSFTDSLGLKLDYKTNTNVYKFENFKFVPIED
jgi:hydroxymethylpyrimidine pyrophosphatase-like HAD family hydrolase